MELDTAVDRPATLDLEWMEGDMPYSRAFGDHFYCRSDGRAECGHVFLAGNGLPARWGTAASFSIGELGFGTGLNFCETWRMWRESGAPTALHFVSFELLPMDRDTIERALSHWPEIEGERRALVDAWPDAGDADIDIRFGETLRLSVLRGDALERLSADTRCHDAWFLDGFAPSRNAAMWSAELMHEVFAHTKPGGSFATYAAAGFVRRNLSAAGFAVSRASGFAGKREMLCGTRPLMNSNI